MSSARDLAKAKAKKYGGEDSAEYRRGRGAKPYRTERVSQTETPETGTYDISSGTEDGHTVSWFNPATYNADNKALSATYGRMVRNDVRDAAKWGIPAAEAARASMAQINQEQKTIVKPSWSRVLGPKRAEKLTNEAYKASESSGFNNTVNWSKNAKRGLTSFRRGGVSKAAGETNYNQWRQDWKGR